MTTTAWLWTSVWLGFLLSHASGLLNWRFLGGSNSSLRTLQPVFGTKFIPHPSNLPGARYSAGTVFWENSMYMFGGYSYSYWNDLWRCDMATYVWTWLGGERRTGVYGSYGIKGRESLDNYPGSRIRMVMEVMDGKAYVFGGYGYAVSSTGHMNDVWRLNLTSLAWTFLHGSTTPGSRGYYGTKGVFHTMYYPANRINSAGAILGGRLYIMGGNSVVSSSPNEVWALELLGSTPRWAWLSGSSLTSYPNYGQNNGAAPGGRYGHSVVGFQGALYVFGGYGYNNERRVKIYLNDVWSYNIVSNVWRWDSGASTGRPLGVYGAVGVASTSNEPPGMTEHLMGLVNERGELALYGGRTSSKFFDSVFVYNTGSRTWTWMGGQTISFPIVRRASLATPGGRYLLNGGVKSGFIFFYGGRQNSSEVFSDLWTLSVECESSSASGCLFCSPGRFVASNISSECTECLPGRWANSYTASTCEICPAGQFSVLSKCISCQAGKYSSKGESECSLCQSGLASFPGASNCHLCPKGFATQNSVCLRCSPGKYTSVDGLSLCNNCEKGSIASLEASTFCVQCRAGTFSDDRVACYSCPLGRFTLQNASSECTECAAGKWMWTTGETFCQTCPGGTFSTEKRDRCDSCPAGRFSIQAGSTCSLCPNGLSSFSGSTYCHFCPIGYSSEGTSTCSKCVSGRFSNVSGTSSCSYCRDGHIAPTSGLTYCQACIPGTYATDSNRVCQSCRKGTFSNAPASFCETCPPGSIASTLRMTVCDLCPTGKFSLRPDFCQECSPGFFAQIIGNGKCSKCPRASFSFSGQSMCEYCYSKNPERAGPAAPKNRKECVCQKGFYGNVSVADGECKPCPDTPGVTCSGNSTFPEILPGYYRPKSNPETAYRCIPAEACLRTNGSTLTTACAPGYSGEGCESCALTFYKDDSLCKSCSTWSTVSFLILCIGAPAGVYLFLENATPAHPKSCPMMLMVLWLQILDALNSNVVEWSLGVGSIFKAISVLNFNIDIFAPECYFTIPFWVKWHIKVSVILTICAIQLGFYALQEWRLNVYNENIFGRRLGKRCVAWFRNRDNYRMHKLGPKSLNVLSKTAKRFKKKNPEPPTLADKESRSFRPYRTSRYIYATVSLFNTLYIAMTRVIFSPFLCVQQSDGIWLMRGEVTQQCFTYEWYQMIISATLIGVLFLMVAPIKLWKFLKKNRYQRDSISFRSYYEPFTFFYRNERYLWPMHELAVKLLTVFLIQVVGFYYPGAGFLMFAACVFIYNSLLVLLDPYTYAFSKRISIVWSLVAAFCAIASKVAVENKKLLAFVEMSILGLFVMAFSLTGISAYNGSKERLPRHALDTENRGVHIPGTRRENDEKPCLNCRMNEFGEIPTLFFCEECDVSLCIGSKTTCWREWHGK